MIQNYKTHQNQENDIWVLETLNWLFNSRFWKYQKSWKILLIILENFLNKKKKNNNTFAGTIQKNKYKKLNKKLYTNMYILEIIE